MRNILIVGAGKSSSYLIKYFLDKSEDEQLQITVGDINIQNAQKLVGEHKNAKAITLDVFDSSSRTEALWVDTAVVVMQ